MENPKQVFTEINDASQTLVEAVIDKRSEESINVQLVWSKKDLTASKKVTYHTQYNLTQDKHDKWIVSRTLCPSDWEVAAFSVSPSKKYVVTLHIDANNKEFPGQFRVYSEATLIKSFRSPKNAHGTIYITERDGTLPWSNDETRFLYVAERKSESPSFWDEKSEDDTTQSTKFEYQDDWGEQYTDKRCGALFMVTVSTGKIEQLEKTPENVTCSDPVFTPDDQGIVFCGTRIDQPRRLGLVHCYNRPIELYHLKIDSVEAGCSLLAKEMIHDQSSSNAVHFRSPRFSWNGEQLAFLATHDVITHNTCSMLCVMHWESKNVSTIVDVVQDPVSSTMVMEAFNGIYCAALPQRNCWTKDSQYIFFQTQVGGRSLWKVAGRVNKSVLSPAYVSASDSQIASETFLDHDDGFLLIAAQSPTQPIRLYVRNADLSSMTKEGYPNLCMTAPILLEKQALSDVKIGAWRVLPIPTYSSDKACQQKSEDVDIIASLEDTSDPMVAKLRVPPTCSALDYEALIVIPKSPPPEQGYPVLLDIHGGPHGVSPVTYRVLYNYFAALGFVIVSVNYRGSIGFGNRSLESLIGKAGTQDVFDCHYGLLYALDQMTKGGENYDKIAIDQSRMHCSGGSHGGFISTHLIGQFPGFYRSCVVRNPVTNLSSVFFTSDIPEWGLAVSGVRQFESILTTQRLKQTGFASLTRTERWAILKRLWDISSMSLDLDRIKTPTLFGLGGKDRRVPPTQGLQLSDSLRALGVEIKVLWYPDVCHSLDSIEAYGDFSVQWALWLLKHNV
uniref:Acylamino-acid-releasing enzyme n=1 Tax=Albugo laibachii Nc14 TaxID=890382 RepID=F0X0P0_9STRA|nr:acylaminoacidreleasing enzyme putative [Albugo laibachii Nc14]|eukprot:CCA27333.1 acylaminoacidreleasing enzyme putative [Albugo laibachii Nc14]